VSESILDIQNLEVSRGEVGQAYEVSLSSLKLEAGDVAAIVGPSGCGKSTLLEAIGLLLEPRSVKHFQLVDFDIALDITCSLRERERRWSRVRQHYLGFVPQSGGLLPFLNVKDNIELPRKMVGCSDYDSLLEEVIERLQLSPLMGRSPAQLSIGERQRVSFVRAIAHRPKLLLADEPTAALDPVLAKELFALIVEIANAFKVAALIVTHEWSLVEAVGIKSIVGTVGHQRRTSFDASA
jgi:putative ABC transport system ATP-binding protein